MTKSDPKPYTEEQYKEFDRYSWLSSSQDQMDRINGRLGLMRMMQELGKDICDVMWQRCLKEDLEKVKKKRGKK